MNMLDIKWIECNLPWYLQVSYEDQPKLQDLSEKEEETFRTTLTNAFINNKKNLDKHKCYYIFIRDQIHAMERSSGISFTTEERFSKEEELWVQFQDKEGVREAIVYFELEKRIKEWRAIQPETIDYLDKLEQFAEEAKQKSFNGRGLNKPGTLIEFENGSLYLIGGGKSADGSYYTDLDTENPYNTIIKRYAIVFDFDSLE